MMLDQRLGRILAEYLEAGESVRWSESPDPAALAREARPLFYFSIPWLGFQVFWTAGAVKGGYAFAAFSIPFWLVGFWLASAPLRARRRAVDTLYAITSKRAIILDAHRGRTVRSFYPADLANVTLIERVPEQGDLILRHDVSKDSDGDTRKEKVGFIGINRPKEVNRILRKLVSEASGSDGE